MCTDEKAIWTETRNTGIVFHFYDAGWENLKVELGLRRVCVIGVEG